MGSRHCDIPTGITFGECLENNRDEFDRWIDLECKVVGNEVERRSNGQLPRRDAMEDLQAEICGFIRDWSVQKRDVDARRVLGGLRTAIEIEGKKLFRTHYDSMRIEEQLAENLHLESLTEIPEDPEEEIIQRENEEEQKRTAARLIGAIKRSADELGVAVNSKDWVATAIEVIRKGVHTNDLKNPEFGQMNFIRRGLESNGYDTTKEPAPFTIRGFINERMDANPHLTSVEIAEMLEAAGVECSINTVRAEVTKARKRLGTLQRAGGRETKMSRLMEELVDKGVKDQRTIEEELRRQRIIFRPTSVQNFLRILLKRKEAAW